MTCWIAGSPQSCQGVCAHLGGPCILLCSRAPCWGRPRGWTSSGGLTGGGSGAGAGGGRGGGAVGGEGGGGGGGDAAQNLLLGVPATSSLAPEQLRQWRCLHVALRRVRLQRVVTGPGPRRRPAAGPGQRVVTTCDVGWAPCSQVPWPAGWGRV